MSSSLCVMVCVLALSPAIVPAASAQSALVEVDAAWEAVNRAEQADADQYAPELMASARQALVTAQAAAADRRQRRQAPELATRAMLEAELARARSLEAVAVGRLQQRKDEIAELQRALGMEVSP